MVGVMSVRCDYIVAVGVVLLVVGGVIVGVGDVRVKIVAQDNYIFIPRYGMRPPGSYIMNTSRVVAGYNGRLDLSGGLSEASLLLPAPSLSNCSEAARVFELVGEGRVDAGKPGYIVVEVTAVLGDNQNITVVKYRVNVNPISEQVASSSGMVTLPLTADHAGVIGYVSGYPGDKVVKVVILPVRGEIPPNARVLTSRFGGNLSGELQVRLTASDVCEKFYHVDSPFLAPAGFDVQQITTPSAILIDTTMLRVGVALMVFGNAVALLGIYGRISRSCGEDKRENLKALT